MDIGEPASGAASTEMDAARRAWRAAHLVPLWESPTAHKPPAPPDSAHLWRWETVRPLLGEAIRLASPASVERRVLSLVNPLARAPEEEWTTRQLAAAMQILLPGETARPHRHSMNALRLMLEGSGAVTIVNGKPCAMAEGDLILTPAWCWHEHVHRGDAPSIWLDALDVPLHLRLGTAKFEPGPVKTMPRTVPDAGFAAVGLVPDVELPADAASSLFRYSYEAASAAAAAAPPGADGARRVRYVDPFSGRPVMALMDAQLIQLDAGVVTRPFRTSCDAICAVLEGAGDTRVGADTLSWRRRDVFTLPAGNWISHRSGDRISRLFLTSDRPVFARLGLWSEELSDVDPATSGA